MIFFLSFVSYTPPIRFFFFWNPSEPVTNLVLFEVGYIILYLLDIFKNIFCLSRSDLLELLLDEELILDPVDELDLVVEKHVV